MANQEILEKIIAALMDQDRDETRALVKKALAEGVEPMDILNKALATGLQELGDLFAQEEVYLPELLLAANIVTEIMNEMKEEFKANAAKIEKRGTVLLCTVEGDVHDIGKSLVGMIMNACGYEIIDAGKDVPNTKMIELVKELHPDTAHNLISHKDLTEQLHAVTEAYNTVKKWYKDNPE